MAELEKEPINTETSSPSEIEAHLAAYREELNNRLIERAKKYPEETIKINPTKNFSELEDFLSDLAEAMTCLASPKANAKIDAKILSEIIREGQVTTSIYSQNTIPLIMTNFLAELGMKIYEQPSSHPENSAAKHLSGNKGPNISLS